MRAQDDPYAILGVSPGASLRELRRARNDLLLHWHPDRTEDPEAQARAARINAAYQVLSDPARRAAYDRGFGAGPLASVLRGPRAATWAPATPDADRAAAQQRLVDRFKDDARRARARQRRWADTVVWPVSEREVRLRLLGRVLPFVVLAIVSWAALPFLTARLPAPLADAAPYLLVFAGVGGLRGLVGRATAVGAEGWGRFTASWVIGVAAIVAVDMWALARLPLAWQPALHVLLIPLALLLAAFGVYRVTRVVHLPAPPA